MTKSIQVTSIPCSCGYLARSAADPNLPVKFDAELNEYSFEHYLANGTKVSMLIYHCPMCGGVASESRRRNLFANISDEEVLRLEALYGKIETFEDIERNLGTPDKDETYRPAPDVVVTQPRTGKRETGQIRVLTYVRLSETADLQFSIYSDGTVESVLAPKHIGRGAPISTT